jgi:hypothetical protein
LDDPIHGFGRWGLLPKGGSDGPCLGEVPHHKKN